MIIPRPRLHGLVFKLALFYALLALPTLLVVESVLLFHEFHQFTSAVANGSLTRAAQHGADELEALWPRLRDANGPNPAALQVWLDAWVLRLQQPRGGLTTGESYVLMELSDAPLAAALLAPDAHALAQSRRSGSWTLQLPTAAEIAHAIAAPAGTAAIELHAGDTTHTTRRVLVPLRATSGQAQALLFVELRLAPPWRHLLADASFESPTVLAFLLVFGLASSIFLAGWVTRRLNRIASAATAWSRGDFSPRIGDRSHDEISHVSALLDRMALDLKALLRSRAQLATLAERQRLARDLHDTVKQKAFALNLQLATARRVLAGAAGSERLDQAQRLTQQIQRELAQILDEMRASDAELPFAERLHTRANEWAHTSGIMPVLDLEDVPSLAAPIEESLLRIVDEALSNVLRHSGAEHVDLALHREAERLRLTIADNGRGIPDEPGSGMGLDNMRARAHALPAGRFEIDTPPGSGTRITVSFIAEVPTT